MIKCGNCGQRHEGVNDVAACYKATHIARFRTELPSPLREDLERARVNGDLLALYDPERWVEKAEFQLLEAEQEREAYIKKPW